MTVNADSLALLEIAQSSCKQNTDKCIVNICCMLAARVRSIPLNCSTAARLRVSDKSERKSFRDSLFQTKGEIVLAYAANAYGGVAVKLHSFLTLALHGGE